MLIHKETTERCHYDTAWTVNILKSITLGIALMLLAARAGGSSIEPRVMGADWRSRSSSADSRTFGVMDFPKHLQFHREFINVMGSRAVATVALAFAWPGPWALVAGMLRV